MQRMGNHYHAGHPVEADDNKNVNDGTDEPLDKTIMAVEMMQSTAHLHT